MFKIIVNYFYVLSCVFQHHFKYYPSPQICKIVLLFFIFPSHRWDLQIKEILFAFTFDFVSQFNIQTFQHPTIQTFIFMLSTITQVLPFIILIVTTILYTFKLISLKNINGPLELSFAIVYSYMTLLRWVLFLPSLTSLLIQPIQNSIYQITILYFQIFLSNYLLRKIAFNQENKLIQTYSKFSFLLTIFETCQVVFSLKENSSVFQSILFITFFTHVTIDLYLDYAVPLEPCLEEFQVKLHISKLVIGIVIAIEVFGQKLGNMTILYGIIVLPFFINFTEQLVQTANLHYSQLNFTDPSVNQNHILKNAENLIYYDNQSNNNKCLRLHQFLIMKGHQKVCTSTKCDKTITNILKNHQNKRGFKKMTRLTILCCMSTLMDEIKKVKGVDFHHLQLTQILFLNFVCKTPLLAYLELKDYQQHGDLFFVFILKILNDIIAHHIVLSQIDLEDLINKIEIQEKQIELKEINLSIQIEEKYLDKLHSLIQMKIDYYKQQKSGFSSLDQFLKIVVRLSRKMQNLLKSLVEAIGIDTEKRNWQLNATNQIIQLRLLSVLQSMIFMDFEQSSIIEGYIEEVLTDERTLPPDRIMNISMIDDVVVALYTSMFRNRGTFLNQNRKQMSKFFGYENELDFIQVHHINQIMPNFIAQMHDALMNHYMENGKTTRFTLGTVTFILNKYHYIECAKLKLDNYFSQIDDYILMASLIKTNINTQYLLFDLTGRIQGISQKLFEFLMKKNFGINFNVYNSEYIQKFINYAYIFMIMPQMFYLFDSQKAQFLDVKNEEVLEEKRLLVAVPKNMNRLMELFNDFREELNQKFKPQETSYVESFKRINSIYSRLSTGKVKKLKKQNYLTTKYIDFDDHGFNRDNHNILMYDEEYRQQIAEFFDRVEVEELVEDCVTYYIRGILHMKIVGHDALCRPFFILEIWDYKEKDMSWMNQRMASFYQEVLTQKKDLQQQRFFQGVFATENVTSFTGGSESKKKSAQQNEQEEVYVKEASEDCNSERNNQSEIPLSNSIIREEEDEDNQYQSENKIVIKEEFSSQNKLIDDQEQLKIVNFNHFMHIPNSEQFSPNSQKKPMSQPANFIEPSYNQNEGVQADFQDLEDELNKQLKKRLVRKPGDPKRLTYFQDKDGEKPQDADDDSSNKPKLDKNVIEVFVNNKKKKTDLFYQQFSDPQKQSINIHHISSAVRIRKEVQANRDWLKSLKMILSLAIFSSILALIFIIVNIVLIYGITNNLLILVCYNKITENLNNIKAPVIYNNYYTQILTYGWLTTLHRNKLYNLSSFIQNEINKKVISIQEQIGVTFDSLSLVYYEIEQQNLFPDINLIISNSSVDQHVQFTQFAQITWEKQHILLDWCNNSNSSQPLSELIFLRNNLVTTVNINKQAVHSLNQIYENNNLYWQNLFLILILSEVFLISFFFGLQAFYWKKPRQYMERQLLLLLRYYESDLSILLVRLQIAKDLLGKNAQVPWKRCNYFNLMFLPLTTSFTDELGIQKRVFTEFFTKSKVHTPSTSKKSKKNISNTTKSLLSSRIIIPSLSSNKAYLVLAFLFSITIIFFTSSYGIYHDQQAKLTPIEQLAMNFMLFTQDIDILITTGLLAKTHQLPDFSPPANILKSFTNIFNSYTSEVLNFYENIWISDLISENDKQVLYNVYRNSFCQELYEQIPFCQFQNMTQSQFQAKYDLWTENDDNSQFLSKGIIGMISQVQQYVTENFDEELKQQKYVEVSDELLVSKEFINIFVQHFLTTSMGFQLFIDTLVSANTGILRTFTIVLNIYLALGGITLICIIVISEWYWIRWMRKDIQWTRMGLSHIPLEVLSEIQVLQAIKQLQIEK